MTACLRIDPFRTVPRPKGLGAALAALAMLAAVFGATAQEPAAAKQLKTMRQPAVRALPAPAVSGPLVPFIDAHVHLNDEAMQLELMRRYGAERAVVFWGRNSENESVAEAARRHPEKFIAFASISPERRLYRGGWDADDPAVLGTLDQLLSTGYYQGIGEISAVHFPSPGLPEADYDPSGQTMDGIMQLARKYRVPVLAHIESTRMRELSALLEKHPEVALIWAHGGYTPLFIARRMLERHPNLYYELSARTWPVHPRSPDYTILRDGTNVWPQWLELIEAMPGRFVVGTDASHRSMQSDSMKFESVQAFLRQLTPATREKVARTNLLGLLGPAPAAGR